MEKNSRRYQTLIRRRKVGKLLARGLKQIDIAMELKTTQGTISKDVTWLREEWKQERVAAFDEKLMLELSKINNLERTFWEAWDKSIEDYKQKMVKAKGIQEGESGTKIKTNFIEKSEKDMIVFGDPRLLQGVEWCIERRCKLLGLDAPEKKELTGKDGKDLFSGMSDDELDRKIQEALNVINAGIK